MSDETLNRRFRVGCAGMFALGMDWGCDDEDEAIVACLDGPSGCEVLDTWTDTWIGPACMEEIEKARARLAAREFLPDTSPEEKR